MLLSMFHLHILPFPLYPVIKIQLDPYYIELQLSWTFCYLEKNLFPLQNAPQLFIFGRFVKQFLVFPLHSR